MPRGEYPSVGRDTFNTADSTHLWIRSECYSWYIANPACPRGMKYRQAHMHEAEPVVIVVPGVLEMIHGRIMKTVKSERKRRSERALKASRSAREFGLNNEQNCFQTDYKCRQLRLVITGAAALCTRHLQGLWRLWYCCFRVWNDRMHTAQLQAHLRALRRGMINLDL